MMDFSDIEKAQKEAFDYLIANSAESETVKDVSKKDAPKLTETLEQLHRYLARLDTLLLSYSEQLKNIDISEVSIHLRDFSKRINLDAEFLKRKKGV